MLMKSQILHLNTMRMETEFKLMAPAPMKRVISRKKEKKNPVQHTVFFHGYIVIL